jgi:hypothetical protein
MWTFAIVVLVGTATLLGTIQVQQGATASLQRLTVQSALADQFRADVAQSVAAPENRDRFVAGPNCLLLRTADGRNIVYHWHDNRLERSEQAGSRTSEQIVPVGPAGTGVEFARTGPGGWVLVLRLSPPEGTVGPNHLREIGAALGGDLR